jgi:hypothetical protein
MQSLLTKAGTWMAQPSAFGFVNYLSCSMDIPRSEVVRLSTAQSRSLRFA